MYSHHYFIALDHSFALTSCLSQLFVLYFVLFNHFFISFYLLYLWVQLRSISFMPLPKIFHHCISYRLAWIEYLLCVKFVVGLLQRNIWFTVMFDHFYLIQQGKLLYFYWSFKFIKGNLSSSQLDFSINFSFNWICFYSFRKKLAGTFRISFGLNFMNIWV